MSGHLLFALIFLLGAIFQSVTIFFLIRGSDHYILRLVKRPVAIGIYGLVVLAMIYLSIHFLVG